MASSRRQQHKGSWSWTSRVAPAASSGVVWRRCCAARRCRRGRARRSTWWRRGRRCTASATSAATRTSWSRTRTSTTPTTSSPASSSRSRRPSPGRLPQITSTRDMDSIATRGMNWSTCMKHTSVRPRASRRPGMDRCIKTRDLDSIDVSLQM
ncbi:hypothetical protein DAI22_03g015801 [Oryza sativa Japonica Group]|nr:hypothetical protein DAI22_03g015801 [Oryza sativa Japonica Group]